MLTEFMALQFSAFKCIEYYCQSNRIIQLIKYLVFQGNTKYCTTMRIITTDFHLCGILPLVEEI